MRHIDFFIHIERSAVSSRGGYAHIISYLTKVYFRTSKRPQASRDAEIEDNISSHLIHNDIRGARLTYHLLAFKMSYTNVG